MTKVQNVERLFVYGTLVPGEKNHHLIEEVKGLWVKASCIGRVFQQTKGEHIGLPCFEPAHDGERVEGMLFTSTELGKYWAMLDKFEGSMYERRLTPIETEHGEVLEGYVYTNIDAP